MAYGLVITYSTSSRTSRPAIRSSSSSAGAISTLLASPRWSPSRTSTTRGSARSPRSLSPDPRLARPRALIGHTSWSGQRWITLADRSSSDERFAKVLMIVVLAKYFADRHDRVGSPLVLLGSLVLLAPAVALCTAARSRHEPRVRWHLFGMAYLAGVPPGSSRSLVRSRSRPSPPCGASCSLPAVAAHGVLDPYADPQGAGWNIIQSLIAIARGKRRGRASRGHAVPARLPAHRESDFVFAGLARTSASSAPSSCRALRGPCSSRRCASRSGAGSVRYVPRGGVFAMLRSSSS